MLQRLNLIEQKYPEEIESKEPNTLKNIKNLGILKAIHSGVDLDPFISKAPFTNTEMQTHLKELLSKFVNAYQELIKTEVLTAEKFQEYMIEGKKSKQTEKANDTRILLKKFVQTLFEKEQDIDDFLMNSAYGTSSKTLSSIDMTPYLLLHSQSLRSGKPFLI